MTNTEVKELFDQAFSDVTKKLVNLNLQKGVSGQTYEEAMQSGYREKIDFNGSLNSTMVCWFSDDLYQYVITTMHGGTPPDAEECPLYLNEYINIISGFAISRINNLTGTKSRLSLPSFYEGKMPVEIGIYKNNQSYALYYDTEYGKLQVFLFIQV